MKEELELATGQVTVPEENVLSGIMQVLEYYDLTPTQIHVYLFLGKNEPQAVGKVALKIGLHRTAVYKTLKELEGLGLVTRSMERPTRYTALSFRRAVQMLWEEKRRGMDALQLVTEALITAYEKWPTVPPNEETNPLTFTVHSTGLFRVKIEELSLTSATRLYYLEDGARRHLEQYIDDQVTVNEDHPELGSFIVFDRAVFLLQINHKKIDTTKGSRTREEWSATEIHVPEVVAAYAELYRLLEAEA